MLFCDRCIWPYISTVVDTPHFTRWQRFYQVATYSKTTRWKLVVYKWTNWPGGSTCTRRGWSKETVYVCVCVCALLTCGCCWWINPRRSMTTKMMTIPFNPFQWCVNYISRRLMTGAAFPFKCERCIPYSTFLTLLGLSKWGWALQNVVKLCILPWRDVTGFTVEL